MSNPQNYSEMMSNIKFGQSVEILVKPDDMLEVRTLHEVLFDGNEWDFDRIDTLEYILDQLGHKVTIIHIEDDDEI